MTSKHLLSSHLKPEALSLNFGFCFHFAAFSKRSMAKVPFQVGFETGKSKMATILD